MIRYDAGSFGFQVLFRLHGSAVFKSIFPAMLSSVIYIVLYYQVDFTIDDYHLLLHPYPMGALISALTFLLSFRANFAYNRYWEACTAVYQMHSKWLDVGMEVTAFHLQSAKYDPRKPPSFGANPNLDVLGRERERVNEQTLGELQEQLDQQMLLEKGDTMGHLRRRIQTLFTRNHRTTDSSHLHPHNVSHHHHSSKHSSKNKRRDSHQKKRESSSLHSTSHHHARQHVKIIGSDRIGHSNGTGDHADDVFLNYKASFGGDEKHRRKPWDKKDGPSPFLEEAAHLLSLLSAVSMSTLRNDLASAASPLTTFIPGHPFPHVDPDDYNADVRKEWTNSHWSVAVFKYLFGLSRSPRDRTLYNAARPFRVIGGVSDSEIELLQAARGPLAKVALCSMWFQEFISREYLAGSLGPVAPPIVSRLYQFTSDGMLGYNQARKVAYIPFPFPHAQITSFFVLVVVGLMPVLMLTFVTNEAFAFCLNLLTVMCFTGLHEVARELENPFQNVPNDIPLNNFQGQYNEALMTMFRGYHPDAFWDIPTTTNNDGDCGLPTVQEHTAH